MKKELRVLIVEDSEEDLLLLMRSFRKLPYEVAFECVSTASALERAMEQHRWDLVISGYTLPEFDGLAALKIVRAQEPDLPFILVSGTIGEESAAAAMRAGAQDYVLKGNLARLAPAIERELREAEIRREHAQSQKIAREAHERNHAIISIAADGIITFDQKGEILSFNPAAERIFGCTAAEAIGDSLSSLLSDSGKSSRRGDKRLAITLFGAGDETSVTEVDGRRKDGTVVPLKVSVSRTHLGEELLFTGMIHDLTEQKRTQDQLRSQFEKMNALRAIDVAITGSFDVRVTLSIVLDQVATLLRVDAADVLLVEPGFSELRCASARGFYSNAVRQRRVRFGEGLVGQAALERCMVEAHDLGMVEEFKGVRSIADEKFVSYYAIPLMAKGRLHGMLEVFHRSPLDVDADWLIYLETLAGQAAIAIDSTLTFEELQRRNAELLTAYDLTIEGWARALDLRDKETEGHTRRVTELTVKLARTMGLSDAEVDHARRGALLHDIGKLGVPDSILFKPGPLTEEEWVVMRKHPTYAYDWLSAITYLRPSLEIPYGHHEKWDGSGYPQGLKGEAIPIAARLFAVIDVWDALTSERPYREAWSREKTLAHIRQGAGTHFDPAVVAEFVKMVEAESGQDEQDLGRVAA